MKSEVRSQKSEFQKLAFIALGSNLGDSRKNIFDAMARLQNFSEEPISKSSLWQTSPVDCPPESLLKKLRKLEIEFGRAPKTILNEPRPLDLDLIAFGNETWSLPKLILPHPRAHLRRFVLQPLSEIAPDFILPGQGKTVSQLLAGLPGDETVTRL